MYDMFSTNLERYARDHYADLLAEAEKARLIKEALVQNPETKDVDDQATALTRARYQRISRFYDRLETLMEKNFRPWRRKVWRLAKGSRMLEVGVGTGKNVEFWPEDRQITDVN